MGDSRHRLKASLETHLAPASRRSPEITTAATGFMGSGQPVEQADPGLSAAGIPIGSAIRSMRVTVKGG